MEPAKFSAPARTAALTGTVTFLFSDIEGDAGTNDSE
jgi:hypothetical protein